LRLFRPAIAAFTMLIEFEEPSDLDKMSLIPAHSTSARTAPPAITPVPGAAGLSSTTPAPSSPVTWCGIVVPSSTRTLACLDALACGGNLLGLASEAIWSLRRR
jgi:hypothetical protein